MKGIYIIENLLNGNIYIGSSNDIKSRWTVHKSILRGNFHENTHLQSSWNKHGELNFIFEIVLLCEEFELFRYEQWFLDNIVRWGIDYNIAKFADAPMRGRNHSEETKIKMSLANKGTAYALGYKHTKETKTKLSKYQKTRVGALSPSSKLIREQVLEIRKLYFTNDYTQKELGRLFVVDETNIWSIVNYKTWKHI